MSALHELVIYEQWQEAITHIQSLPDGDAAHQLFFTQYNSTAIMRACHRSAPLVLVQLIITKAKLDPRKRCLLAIVSLLRATATPPSSSS